MKSSINLFYEMKQHVPYTAMAAFTAISSVILIKFFFNLKIGGHVFHILHPLHVVASAITSAGILYKYRPKMITALFVGIVGSIAIGSVSDILLPYLGATIFQMHPHFHLPVIESPLFIAGAAILGSFIGIYTKISKFPHFLHVGISIFASLFYLLAYTTSASLPFFLLSIIIVFFAVLIPCCISDVIFPLCFLKKNH